MPQTPDHPAVKNGHTFPSPPRVHWAILLISIGVAEALAFRFVPDPYRNFTIYALAAAWPTYLCIWVRKIEASSTSLYWAIASLVIGVGFLFSWLLWIVVIFELREEMIDHYNRREPMNLRLNWFLTLFFSFVYFQFALNRITRAKEVARESFAVEPEGRVTA